MSTEQVLLIALIVVLPLVQYLIRLTRQRHGHEPAQAEGQPASSAGRPPMRELQPPPSTEDHTLSDSMTTPARKPALDADRPVAPPARRSVRRGTAVVGLYDPLDLRRAIVLMTVLEPCRAIHPHD